MRMIMEERDGLTGEFYAKLQERADELDGLVPIGDQTGGHVTILAIEAEGGTFGWLKGTQPGETARTLRLAAAVLVEEDHSSQAAEVAAYLTGTAEHLEREDAAVRARRVQAQ